MSLKKIMPLDTYTFFVIIMSGFLIVWSYRHFGKSQNLISDFEYLGFSAFWGLVNIAIVQLMSSNRLDAFNKLLLNPYSSGVAFSIFGFIFGSSVGRINFWAQDIYKSYTHQNNVIRKRKTSRRK